MYIIWELTVYLLKTASCKYTVYVHKKEEHKHRRRCTGGVTNTVQPASWPQSQPTVGWLIFNFKATSYHQFLFTVPSFLLKALPILIEMCQYNIELLLNVVWFLSVYIFKNKTIVCTYNMYYTTSFAIICIIKGFNIVITRLSFL